MLAAISKAMEFSETTNQFSNIIVDFRGLRGKTNLLPSQPSRQVTLGISPTKLVVAVNQRPRVPFRSVMPAGNTRKVASAPEMSLSAMKQRNTEFVSQTLHLLFHCKYLILTEYVEWMIPLLYVAYFPVLKQFSNAIYFPSTRGIENDDLLRFIATIVAYAALELGRSSDSTWRSQAYLVSRRSTKWRSCSSRRWCSCRQN